MKLQLLILLATALSFLYSSPVCEPKACPFIICTNNALLHTLTCLNNYEAHFNWTLESDTILHPKLSHYGHNISHRTFNYSSLPYGRYEIKLFFGFEEDSLLHIQCSCHHCSCTFSTVLEATDSARSARNFEATIKLIGDTSRMRLEVVSKKKIDFQNLLQSSRTIVNNITI